MCTSDIFLGFIAILFPPLTVWVKRGICSADSLINILLSCIGYIPGLLHAWYIIAKFPDDNVNYESLPQDAEHGHITYVYVQGPAGHQHQVPKNSSGAGYGTTMPMAAPAAHQEQSGAWTGAGDTGAGEGSSAAPPPTYAQALKGDNKVQTKD